MSAAILPKVVDVVWPEVASSHTASAIVAADGPAPAIIVSVSTFKASKDAVVES